MHEKKLIIAATIIVTILVLFELGSLRANRFSDSDILTSGRVTTTAQPATQKTTAAPSTSPLKLQDPIETQPLEPPESTVPTEPTEATMENIYFSLPPETTAPQATEQLVTLQYATVALPNNPPDYNAQWEAGYLLAIDNPDPTYKCGKVELSDEDRDLIERLCNGEFGSGGFIGASLIAQCVKNAMYFEGPGSAGCGLRPPLPILLEANPHPFHRLVCFCCCSVAQSCPTLCDPMGCSTPGLLVLYRVCHHFLDSNHPSDRHSKFNHLNHSPSALALHCRIHPV